MGKIANQGQANRVKREGSSGPYGWANMASSLDSFVPQPPLSSSFGSDSFIILRPEISLSGYFTQSVINHISSNECEFGGLAIGFGRWPVTH
ncbi:hypothetical protein EVAR_80575_1 [Eumeta japonica]|uniref:Uncharacterized protein n=1 Tax=Eumeta variegata TaxID=151549 RepID=A0A4C1TLL9_EUMVA|nr:hypothetical protein EVAR_80575_1 [Eumeta japonica]